MTLDDLPELAKPKEIAAYLRVSVNYVYDAINRDLDPMPHVRLGPHGLRVHRWALAAWLGLDAPVQNEHRRVDLPAAFNAEVADEPAGTPR